MFESIIVLLESFFIMYGPLGVFFASLIEEIIAPIPSAIVILGSSFFILEGQAISLNSILNLLLNISLPVALGMSLGSLFIYGLCYFLGKEFVIRWGKYFGLKWEDMEKANEKFKEQKRDEIVLFTVRTIPIIPSVAISGICGLIRYDLKKYLLVSFLGSFIRATTLGLIGWQFGSLYRIIAEKISFLEEITLVVIAISILGYLIHKKYYKKNITSKNRII